MAGRLRSPAARTPGLVALVAASVFWGLAVPATKLVLDDFGPFTLMLVVLAAATAVLWGVLLARGYRRPRSWRLVATLGLLEPGAAYLAEAVGMTRTSATNAAVLVGMEASFVVILAAIFLREQITLLLVAALAVAFLGVVVLEASGGSTGPGLGDALVLVSSLACAAYTIVVRSQGVEDGTEDVLVLTAHQFLVATALVLTLCVPAWASGYERLPHQVPARGWAAAICIGVLGHAVCFLLYNWAAARVNATTDAVVLNLIPAFALAGAVLWLREPLTWPHAVGAALIAASLVGYLGYEVRGRSEAGAGELIALKGE